MKLQMNCFGRITLFRGKAKYYLFIYVFYESLLQPLPGVNTHQRQGKNKWTRRAKEKGIDVQRVKPLTPTRAIDALIGEEEQTGKIKKEQKERNMEPIYNPGVLGHSVASYDSQGL